MERRRNIALVDSRFRRRAAIAHELAVANAHIEPFEDVSEILSSWPHSGTILVEDRGQQVEELVGAMTEGGQWLPLVAFSERPGTHQVVRAILAGAIDYVEWPLPANQLIPVIDAAEANGAEIGSLKLREARARGRIQRLTRREREVLAGVAGGLSNRLIGQQLAISPRTVEIHRANMLTKMGAQHTSEAIRIAIEASLVA